MNNVLVPSAHHSVHTPHHFRFRLSFPITQIWRVVFRKPSLPPFGTLSNYMISWIQFGFLGVFLIGRTTRTWVPHRGSNYVACSSLRQDPTGNMTTEVLPVLRTLLLEGLQPSGPVRESTKAFSAAIQLSHQTVVLQRWESRSWPRLKDRRLRTTLRTKDNPPYFPCHTCSASSTVTWLS